MTPVPPAEAISILIRTFNSERTLGRLLAALSLQTGDEVLVVDSGSTDRTLVIAGEYGTRILSAPPPFNYSKSLNIGFRAAQHPWVLVMSSHSLPLVPYLLEVFRRAARDFPSSVVVGYGPNVFDGRRHETSDEVRYFRQNDPAFVCSNANTLYRRSAWERTPFDEGIRTGEDRAWLDEIFRQGCEVASIPKARTMNLNQYSLRYMFMKGYSDRRADPGQPITLVGLFLAWASLMKRLLRYGMPVGNWSRGNAHALGQFFGSYHRPDNRPWTRS